MPSSGLQNRPGEFWGKIDVRDIRPSPTNPRKHFDDGALAELAESIKAQGILEPPVVRPRGETPDIQPRFVKGHWEDLDHYELIVGERRWRAARMAGLTAIDVIVRQVDDATALDLQAIENEQRADVLVTERAAHYQRMRDAGRTIEQIAAAVGKGESSVREALLLARMPAKLAAAVDAGTVPVSTAALVCRVPGETSRNRVAACVLEGVMPYETAWVDPEWEPKRPEWKSDEGECEPLTYRETKDLIHEFCQVELKSATFSRKALDLVPGAGSCDDCPKRAGNDPDLKAEGVRADICTDPDCFRAKTAANAKRIRAEAESSGKTVLTGKQAESLFGFGGILKYDAPYLDLAGETYDPKAGKNKPNSKLLGKCKDSVVIAIDPLGRPHQLVPRDVAAKALKDHGITLHTRADNRGAPKTEDEKKDEARRRFENLVARERDAVLLRMIASEAEMKCKFVGGAHSLALVRHLVDNELDQAWGERLEDICRIRNLQSSSKKPDQRAAIEKHVAELDADELFGLLVQFVTLKSIHFGEAGKLLKLFGIDSKAIEKQVRQRLKEEKSKSKTKPMPAAARKTKAGALDLGADWRDKPIRCLDITAATCQHLECSFEVFTVGELADALNEGDTLGLDRSVIAKIVSEIESYRQ